MSITEFCKGPVITASPDDQVLHAARLMRDNNVGSIVVLEGGRPVGMLTDRDIMLRMIEHGSKWPEITVREVMTANPVTVNEQTGILELIRLMKKTAVRRFPVIDDGGKLSGIITLDDLIELLGMEMADLGNAVSFEVGHQKLVMD
jgi:CBS domain-containing protein